MIFESKNQRVSLLELLDGCFLLAESGMGAESKLSAEVRYQEKGFF